MTKVIGFISQKGGSGKSTMTRLTANYLAYGRGKRVAVLDCDYPQLTIMNKRKKEEKRGEGETEGDRLIAAFEKTDAPPYDVFACVFNPDDKDGDEVYLAADMIRWIEEKDMADYVLVDMPGTLNIDGFDDVLPMVNYVFVPIMEDPDVVFSSMQTLLYIVMVCAEKEHGVKGVYEFWHKYRYNTPEKRVAQTNAEFEPYNLKLRQFGIDACMMRTKIGNSTAVFNDEMLNNTLVAPPSKYMQMASGGFTLGPFFSELLYLLEK